jgi:hypothetical protein
MSECTSWARRVAHAAAAAVLCAASAPGWAVYTTQVTTTAEARANVIVRSGSPSGQHLFAPDDSRTVTTAGGPALARANTTIDQSFRGIDNQFSSYADASATAGGLHLAAHAGGTTHLATPSLSLEATSVSGGASGAWGSFTDGLTFKLAGIAAGTQVRVRYGVRVEGTLGWGGSPGAFTGNSTTQEARWDVEFGSTEGGGNSVISTLSNVVTTEQHFGEGTHVLETLVTLGAATPLTLTAQVGARGSVGLGCRVNCNVAVFGEVASFAAFANTFAWDGLFGISTLAGESLDLAGLSLMSDSGFDYRHAYAAAPVPEPSTALQAMLGLMLGGWLLRRRGGAPQP